MFGPGLGVCNSAKAWSAIATSALAKAFFGHGQLNYGPWYDVYSWPRLSLAIGKSAVASGTIFTDGQGLHWPWPNWQQMALLAAVGHKFSRQRPELRGSLGPGPPGTIGTSQGATHVQVLHLTSQFVLCGFGHSFPPWQTGPFYYRGPRLPLCL